MENEHENELVFGSCSNAYWPPINFPLTPAISYQRLRGIIVDNFGAICEHTTFARLLIAHKYVQTKGNSIFCRFVVCTYVQLLLLVVFL